MTIRTPTPSTNRQALYDLNTIKARMALNSEKLTSGSAITRLGDDPTGAALVVDFRASVAKNKAYVQQAETAGTYLSASESAVSTMQNAVVRLLELGQEGLTGTTGATGRASMAAEVTGLSTNVLDSANTQVQGKYVFAGTLTTAKPFAANPLPSPPNPPVVYSGNSGTVTLDVSVSAAVTTNIPGDSVCFGPGGAGSSTDIFQAMADLANGLTSNNTAQIQTAYNNLKSINDNLNTAITDLGGRQAGLTNLKDNLSAYNVSLQAIQGTYEDVDYAGVISQYYQDQTAQQVSLSTMAKTNSRNLFDFIS